MDEAALIDASALVLGGVPAATLARAYGTPLLVLDLDVLDSALARFAALSAEFAVDVAYAGKALLFTALAKRVARAGLGLDVCSLGELLVAERAQFPPARLTLHGCGKTTEELAAAVAGRVGRVVVDHRDELERLAGLARPEQPIDVLLRLNPGIEAETHRYIRTAGADSKFGFVAAEAVAAVSRTLEIPGLRLAGFHAHIGSNIFAPEPYLATLEVLFESYARALAAGAPLGDLVIGGGFGVATSPGGERFDAAALLGSVTGRTRELAARYAVAAPRLGIEPGRAIVAEAGTSLYSVVTVKQHGERRFVIVDGGLADNPRPALYGADHAPLAVGRAFATESSEALVCGRSCESDELGIARLPVDLHAGDLLALRSTGAYTYSMSSNYNRFPRPAVVFAGAGSHRAVINREPQDALLAFEAADGL
jgi:diaminopimelate decarboxylase